MTNLPIPFTVTKFFGDAPGPDLLVLGAVHGNEICGPTAIHQMIAEIEAGHIRIKSGSVTFVPITNPKAFYNNEREGDRNLNRNLTRYETPTSFEDKIANVLIPIMEQCDVLLDIHSFKTQGDAFIFVGPEDNNGTLQSFQHGEAEIRFAQALGFDTMVYGWLDTFDDYVTDQNAFLDQHPEIDTIRSQRNFGIGTTEYFRTLGKYGVTIECGNHTDPNAVPIAYRAIQGALAHLDLSDDVQIDATPFQKSYKFTQILLRKHANDRFAKPWTLFHPVAAGELLAIRQTGEELRAPADGAVIFSYDDADVGSGWLYFAELSDRGTR
jgi:predicted deacylase